MLAPDVIPLHIGIPVAIVLWVALVIIERLARR